MKKGVKVLLVEDEALVYEVILRCFKKMSMNFEIIWAKSGEEALEKFKEFDYFSLAIIDHGLGGISGTIAAQEMKRLRPEFQIIMMSGYGKDDIEDGFSGDNFIQKPFSLEIFCEKMGEVLSLQK